MTFNDNNRPIYLQIADKICDDIMLGTLREEQRIPSVRDYAAMMEAVSYTHLDVYKRQIQTDEEKGIFSLQALIFKLNEGGDTSTNTDWTFAKSYYFDAGQDWGIDKTLNFTEDVYKRQVEVAPHIPTLATPVSHDGSISSGLEMR